MHVCVYVCVCERERERLCVYISIFRIGTYHVSMHIDTSGDPIHTTGDSLEQGPSFLAGNQGRHQLKILQQGHPPSLIHPPAVPIVPLPFPPALAEGLIQRARPKPLLKHDHQVLLLV